MAVTSKPSWTSPEARIHIGEGGVLRCEGSWTIPHLAALGRALAGASWPRTPELTCDATRITAMDTGGALVLHRVVMKLRQAGQQVSIEGLRPEFTEILRMVSSNFNRIELPAAAKRGWFKQFHRARMERTHQAVRALEFVGESAVEIWRALKVPSRIRWRTLLRSLELDGFRALPITGLLSFLIGVVIAYQGAEQLRQFGANIFVVDLVGISLLREISPLIVAILIAGRSGSASSALRRAGTSAPRRP